MGLGWLFSSIRAGQLHGHAIGLLDAEWLYAHQAVARVGDDERRLAGPILINRYHAPVKLGLHQGWIRYGFNRKDGDDDLGDRLASASVIGLRIGHREEDANVMSATLSSPSQGERQLRAATGCHGLEITARHFYAYRWVRRHWLDT